MRVQRLVSIVVAAARRLVAVRIGRSIVESNTKSLFEKLQKVLGRVRPIERVAR